MHTKATDQCQAEADRRAKRHQTQLALLRIQADDAKSSRATQRCVAILAEKELQANCEELEQKRKYDQALMDLRRKKIVEDRMAALNAQAEAKERSATTEAELWMAMMGGHAGRPC
jgi:hypothetical protein